MHPYLVGGIGAIDNKVERAFGINDSHTSFMANAGVGIVWPFSSWGRLVADARYRYVDNANNSLTGNRQSMNDWLFSVGLQIPFGPPPQVARAAPPAAMPAPMPPPPPPPPAARNFELKAEVGADVIDVVVEEREAGAAREAITDLQARGELPEGELRGTRAGYTLFVPDGPENLAVLIRGLDKAGVRFGAVSVSRPTLDDVFLAATGGRMAAADADGESEDAQGRDREPAGSGRRAS